MKITRTPFKSIQDTLELKIYGINFRQKGIIPFRHKGIQDTLDIKVFRIHQAKRYPGNTRQKDILEIVDIKLRYTIDSRYKDTDIG